MKSALILLNGELRGAGRVRAAARRADAVICADGGARHAAALRLMPDFVVGDMDSLPAKRPSAWKTVVYRGDRDPNRSDLDKALDLARSLGVREVVVAGALGGGLDHELVNFAVLEKTDGLEVSVVADGTAILLGRGRRRLPFKKGARFTLLAAPRARLSLSGARYGLKDEVLTRGSRGLGNRAEGAVTVRVREGAVWIVAA